MSTAPRPALPQARALGTRARPAGQRTPSRRRLRCGWNRSVPCSRRGVDFGSVNRRADITLLIDADMDSVGSPTRLEQRLDRRAPSTDNVGVQPGYSVYDEWEAARRSRLRRARPKLDGLTCGSTDTFRNRRIDAAGNHSSRARLTLRHPRVPILSPAAPDEP